MDSQAYGSPVRTDPVRLCGKRGIGVPFHTHTDDSLRRQLVVFKYFLSLSFKLVEQKARRPLIHQIDDRTTDHFLRCIAELSHKGGIYSLDNKISMDNLRRGMLVKHSKKRRLKIDFRSFFSVFGGGLPDSARRRQQSALPRSDDKQHKQCQHTHQQYRQHQQ